MMDWETGEEQPDHETGELPAVPRLNCETGELEMNCNRPSLIQRKPFKIPKNYTRKATKSKLDSCAKKGIIRTSNNMSPALLLLLPVFFLPSVGIVISIVEILIHMWCHRKNKKLQNTDKYYESPFHIFVCEFCKLCIDESAANKITKLQDKRNNKFTKYGIEYVRRVVT